MLVESALTTITIPNHCVSFGNFAFGCENLGNQVIKIDDDAVDPVYNGCFNFNDGADEDVEYDYDQNGNLTMDLNREICSISYNCLNLPQRVDFQDGSYVLYTYNAGGEKLRTDYYINPLPNMVPQVNGVMFLLI